MARPGGRGRSLSPGRSAVAERPYQAYVPDPASTYGAYYPADPYYPDMDKPSQNQRFEMRLPLDLAERIDRWRARQPDVPNRAEAARRLMVIGLEGEEARARRRAPADRPESGA
jgi:hypothetical protein